MDLEKMIVEFRRNAVWLLIILLFSMIAALPAHAQTNSNKQQQIEKNMVAIDAASLYTSGLKIFLWGVKPVADNDMVLHLRALDRMDQLIDDEPVRCQISAIRNGQAKGRCVVKSGEDLALAMLSSGYATVNREDIYNSKLSETYMRAEATARQKHQGVWAAFYEDQVRNVTTKTRMVWGVMGLVIFLGLMSVIISITVSKAAAKGQAGKEEESDKKEGALVEREKKVILAGLQSELMDNQSKIEAYLIIYREMLKSLKDPIEPKKYQESGDMLAKYPVLEKKEFLENAQRLSTIDVKLASELSELYGHFHESSDYLTLQTSDPLPEVVDKVESAVMSAERLMEKINGMLNRLNNV